MRQDRAMSHLADKDVQGLSRRAWLAAALSAGQARAQPMSQRVPVLCYHRVATDAADSMTLRSANFAAHLRSIEALGCRVVPLADVVAYRLGQLDGLPPRAVALAGHAVHLPIGHLECKLCTALRAAACVGSDGPVQRAVSRLLACRSAARAAPARAGRSGVGNAALSDGGQRRARAADAPAAAGLQHHARPLMPVRHVVQARPASHTAPSGQLPPIERTP